MSIESVLAAASAAIGRGAALVYHDVVATGAAVTAWEEGNPAIGALVASGMSYAEAALARFGVPAGTIEVVGDDILAALKSLAALDATVPSMPAIVTSPGPVQWPPLAMPPGADAPPAVAEDPQPSDASSWGEPGAPSATPSAP